MPYAKRRCSELQRLAGEPNECPDLKPALIPPVHSMYKNISCIWPKMRSALGRVWMVDLLVAVRVLPLQFASLLIVTLPLTLPRLLALQLANPASVVEGARSGGRHILAAVPHLCLSMLADQKCLEQLPPLLAAALTLVG